MKLKRFFLIVVSVIGYSTTIFSQESRIGWQPTHLDIDGIPNDWTTQLRFYNSDTKISFEFRNDNRQLYFVLKSYDKALYRQIQFAGLNLKFTVESSPKVTAFFSLIKHSVSDMKPFPPHGMPGENNSMNQQSGFNPPPFNDELGHSPTQHVIDTASIHGFLISETGIILSETKDEKHIRFAKSPINIDEVAFEMAIPLQFLFGNEYKMTNISDIPIKFTITIPAMQERTREPNDRMGSFGRQGGGGRRMGGEGRMNIPGNESMHSEQALPPMDKFQGISENANTGKKSFKFTFTLNKGE